MKFKFLILLMSTTCSAALPAAAVAQTPASASGASEAAQINEIIVTARKREERLLSIPMAITAMTADQVEQRGIVSVSDLATATPGVSINATNAGRNDRSFQQISTRGFTPSTTDSTLTASFINGVPVTSPTALNAISDPSRVEVLKGPQNAHFGRNAFAGAINVITKDPSDKFGGDISASVTNRDGYDIQAAIEGPLIGEVLGFRLSGRAFAKGGSYINAANPGERLGDQQTRSANLTLAFNPSEAFSVKAVGIYSQDNDGPSAQGMLSAWELRAVDGAVNIPALSNSNAGTLVLPSVANCVLNGNPFMCGALPSLPRGFSPASNTAISPSITDALADGSHRPISAKHGVHDYGLKRRYIHANLTMDLDLGDSGFTLSSLTGYNNERFSQMQDFDNYDSSSFSNPAATAANGLLPYWSMPYAVERNNRDFSQELRLAYDDAGAISGLIGASYLWSKNNRDNWNMLKETVSDPNAVRSATIYSAPYEVRTLGAFASVNVDFTEKFSISAEGRYQRDRIYAYSGGGGANISPSAAEELGIEAGYVAPLTSFASHDFNNFMPRIIANYEFSPNAMIYASWSKAVNVSIASFNARLFSGTPGEIAQSQALGLPTIVKPEKLTNYEVGAKGRLFDGALTYTLAAFAAEWNDQHNLRTIGFVDTSITPNATATVHGVANSGRALVKGLELDLSASPADGVALGFSGAFIDTNVRSFSDQNTERLTGMVGEAFRGNSLPMTSKYSFTVSPAFFGDIPNTNGWSWFLRSDISHKSKQYVDYSNLYWMKSRTLVNMRFGVELDDLKIELFAKNLLNDKGYTGAAPIQVFEPSNTLVNRAFGYMAVGLPELRTVGLKISNKF